MIKRRYHLPQSFEIMARSTISIGSSSRILILTIATITLSTSLIISANVDIILNNNNINSSSSTSPAGVFWSSSDETLKSSDDDSDGGFSSLDGMLHWAIGHSDPAKLKETSNQVQKLSPRDLQKRQLEIQELVAKLKMPSDAELMKIAIADLHNRSISLEDRHRTLQELLILVEPIDNANNLEKLGGLAVIVQELDSLDHEVQISCAWILGKSSQNNPVVQKQILELGALAKLMKMVKSDSVEAAVKALYAISALIRNSVDGQELFYAEAGPMMLQDVISNSSIDIRLRRKAVYLVGDLVEYQLQDSNRNNHPYFSNGFFLKSVVDLTALHDLDLQEKALLTIKNLLQLETTDALVLKDFCGLDKALETMRHQLENYMLDEDQRDYAMDLETLRGDVETFFYKKLRKIRIDDQVRMVPT